MNKGSGPQGLWGMMALMMRMMMMSGDVEENDVGVKATVSIFIWHIRGGEEDIKKRSGFVDISHIAQRTQV